MTQAKALVSGIRGRGCRGDLRPRLLSGIVLLQKSGFGTEVGTKPDRRNTARYANSEVQMMARSLSTLGAKLVLHLEWQEQPAVTIEEAMDILGCSYDSAKKVIHRLVRERWLAPITRGRYELIPAARGEHAFPDPNPFFIGSGLVSPYYFSFATAAYFHALSTQASATVYIATTARHWRRLLTVRGREYRLVKQAPHKFFGSVEVDAYGTPVMMTTPEKTVVDCLDRPLYAGELPEIAAMLWRGKGRLEWEAVADYALRFESHALVQRLGYLVALLDIPVSAEARDRMLSGVGSGTRYLGRRRRWGTGGEYDAAWRIVDNVPRDELLAEIGLR